MIIEAQPLVLAALADAVRSSGAVRVSGVARSSDAAPALWPDGCPSIAIADAGLLQPDAADAIADLGAGTRVLVRTHLDNVDHVRLMLACGADGVVSAAASLDEFRLAVRAVLAGERFVSPPLRSRLDDEPASREVETPYLRLTAREREVLLLTVLPLEAKATAAELSLSEATVRRHLHNAYGKLGVASKVEALVFLLRLGVVSPQALGAKR